MKVLIVDDEPYARRRLGRMVAAMKDCEVVGEASDGSEVLDQVRLHSPNVILLDIKMAGLDGLTLAKQEAQNLPPIIFTTAYDEFAVDAFDAEAVDYLLKPVEPERLARALDRCRRRSSKQPADPPSTQVLERLVARLTPPECPRLSAKRGHTVHFFDPRRITVLHSEDDYVALVARGEKYLLQESLESLEERLRDWGYLRIHRSYLVNLRLVTGMRSEDGCSSLVMVDGRTVPISRRRLPEIKARLSADSI